MCNYMVMTLQKNRADFEGLGREESPEREAGQGYSVSWGKTYQRTIDANGNLSTDNMYSYTYDAANRLIRINTINPQPVSMTDTITFTYDGFGRRVAIVEGHGSTVLTSKTFVWNGGVLAQERDGTGHTVTKQFFALGEQMNGTNYYFVKDYLSSIREMTDSSGNVHASYDFDAYGRSVKLVGDLDADFGYANYYVNKTTGLDLTWYRAYDPDKGRWLSRDPMGEGIGPNLYNYVGGNPVRWFDPWGLCPEGPTPVPSSDLNPNFEPANPSSLGIPVPGSPGNTWVPAKPSGTGDRSWAWKPKTPLPDQSQPRASYSNEGYYSVTNGLGGSVQHYDPNGQPISPDEAHPPEPSVNPSCPSDEPPNRAPRLPGDPFPGDGVGSTGDPDPIIFEDF